MLVSNKQKFNLLRPERGFNPSFMLCESDRYSNSRLSALNSSKFLSSLLSFPFQVDLSGVSEDDAMGFRNEVKLLMKLRDKRRIIKVGKRANNEFRFHVIVEQNSFLSKSNLFEHKYFIGSCTKLTDSLFYSFCAFIKSQFDLC